MKILAEYVWIGGNKELRSKCRVLEKNDGDNILEILKSRAIIEKVLLTKIQEEIPQKNKTLAEFYLSFSSLGKGE